jgi:multimeric flavodoxin WrbA
MNPPKKALLLIGSPKVTRSTSESLGTYLLDKIRERGAETEKLMIAPAVKTDNGIDGLLKALDRSDLIILAFPLYIDSLPYPVIKALELIALHWQKTGGAGKRRLAAICNCGFPEAKHTDTALAICRQFTRETGIKWAGGLGLGGGEYIDGRHLNERGGMVRNIKRSLEITADTLSRGEAVPEEAIKLMSKRLMPVWLYLLVGGLGWKGRAWKNKALAKIHDKPYLS